MNVNDYQKFKEILAGLGDLYEKKITKALATVFWDDFKEISIEDFARAVSSHRKDPDQGMFFPKTANLFKQLNGTSKDQKRSIESAAELAWSDVIAFVTYNGVYGNYQCDDKIAMAAMKQLGGLSVIGNTSYDKQTWLKKEFISLYDSLIGTPEDRLPKNVLGIVSSHAKKIESRQGMQNMIGKAQEMIDEAQSEGDRQATGQKASKLIFEMLGKNYDETRDEASPELEESKNSEDRYKGLSLEDRRSQMILDAKAKQKIKKGW